MEVAGTDSDVLGDVEGIVVGLVEGDVEDHVEDPVEDPVGDNTVVYVATHAGDAVVGAAGEAAQRRRQLHFSAVLVLLLLRLGWI